MPKAYYIILGVSKNAELSIIKRAYRQAVKKFHPDLNRSLEDTEKFLEIKEAYDTLGNEYKRRNYDETLAVVRDSCTYCCTLLMTESSIAGFF